MGAFCDFTITSFSERRVEADVWQVMILKKVHRSGAAVKAITYHNLSVKYESDWQGMVTFERTSAWFSVPGFWSITDWNGRVQAPVQREYRLIYMVERRLHNFITSLLEIFTCIRRSSSVSANGYALI